MTYGNNHVYKPVVFDWAFKNAIAAARKGLENSKRMTLDPIKDDPLVY